MIPALSRLVPAGILLPESIVHTDWLAILATFVAINTVMYGALAVVKILPKLHPGSWFPARQERAETRSIYPDGKL
jgi:hypothetical protein